MSELPEPAPLAQPTRQTATLQPAIELDGRANGATAAATGACTKPCEANNSSSSSSSSSGCTMMLSRAQRVYRRIKRGKRTRSVVAPLVKLRRKTTAKRARRCQTANCRKATPPPMPRTQGLPPPAVMVLLTPIFLAATLPVYAAVRGGAQSIESLTGSRRAVELCMHATGVVGCGAYQSLLQTDPTNFTPSLETEVDAFLARRCVGGCWWVGGACDPCPSYLSTVGVW